MDRVKHVSMPMDKAKVQCEKHDLQADNVCMTCKEVMCAKCVVSLLATNKHSGHNIALIDDAFSSRRAELDKSSTYLSDLYKSITKEHESMIQKLEQEASEANCNIGEMVKAAHKEISAWGNDSKKKLTKAVHDVKFESTKKLDEFNTKFVSIQDETSATEAKLSQNDLYSLFHSTQADERVQTLGDNIDDYSLSTPYIHLEKNKFKVP